MKMKKLLSLALAAGMSLSLFAACGGGGEQGSGGETQTGDKPAKIKIMTNGTVFTASNGRDKFEKRWEELTGIDLEITQPDHDSYYDVLGQTMSAGPESWPDVVLLSPTYYAGYAEEGALWDMTEAWEKSELKKSGRINNPELIDQLYLNTQDGHRLYGFAPARGSGCITYVKKKWLDNCGLSVPQTYDEYLNMLKAFREGDPDGNGKKDTEFSVAAPGLIGNEEPYTNYLPEFYQSGYPTFYQKEDGTWVDGFLEQPMKDALTRLRDAYQQGLIDKMSVKQGTKDIPNKFYDNKFGVFTYWAGTWATNLKTNLKANGLDDELVALPPIKELGNYLERRPAVWCITSSCKNPEAVFKYFIESMLDGGDMQVLWTYGVKGTHWDDKAETVLGKEYKEGEFHMLPSLEKKSTAYTKNHIDPMLSIGDFKGEDPGANQVAPEARASQETFNKNAKLAPNVMSSEEMSKFNGSLTQLKNSLITEFITSDKAMSIEELYAKFQKERGEEWSKAIVDSLNAKSQKK